MEKKFRMNWRNNMTTVLGSMTRLLGDSTHLIPKVKNC